LGDEGGRNPVLVLVGEAVLCNAKEGLDGDVEADFFASFANGALLERFEIVQLSADDTPATGLGRKNAEGEQTRWWWSTKSTPTPTRGTGTGCAAAVIAPAC
jgi:hypothetical protein